MKSIYEFLLKNKTTTSTQDNDYVDLGLPSGLLWARCNIGAEEPTDYGDYFMWGSTEPNTNDDCFWDITPFNDGHAEFNEKYFESIKNSVCPNGTLTPEYDAATVMLGGDWRLPTSDDFKELMYNTKHEWIKNYQDSKINGVLLTAKNAEAAKANYIKNDAELFIPAGGCRSVSGFSLQGSHVLLWSSSIDTNTLNCAKRLHSTNSSCHMSDNSRYYGFCLRGVRK